MSPRPADPSVRTALIDAAARVIADDGQHSLTLRRLADEVGTSTMSVYTHFGGMDAVRREVRREGFGRLATHLQEVSRGRDPVKDLVLLGWAYYRSAMTSPNLYRVMFMEQPLDEADAAAGGATFDVLVAGVDRCVAAGRFGSAEPAATAATQLWAVTHGLVTLRLVGCLAPDQTLDCLVRTSHNLFLAYGDEPGAAGRSVAAARRRISL